MRLVLDWDGTCTERDSLHMVLEHFGDPAVYQRVEGSLLRGEITYRQLMEEEFSTVRGQLEEVLAFLLAEARLRPGFHELVAKYDPVILSSGFCELIEPVLAREGVTVELRANRLDPRPDGWVVRWRDESRCPVCGDLCKQRGLPDGAVVFVGDGYSDRCAALVAERVFARDELARWLDDKGVGYEPYHDFTDVLAALA